MSKKRAVGKHKRRRDRDRCPKGHFYNLEDAELKLAQIKAEAPPTRRIPHRAYRCDRCPFWHLTSTRKPGALKKGAEWEGRPA